MSYKINVPVAPSQISTITNHVIEELENEFNCSVTIQYTSEKSYNSSAYLVVEGDLLLHVIIKIQDILSNTIFQKDIYNDVISKKLEQKGGGNRNRVSCKIEYKTIITDSGRKGAKTFLKK